jgi:hypothetical protein
MSLLMFAVNVRCVIATALTSGGASASEHSNPSTSNTRLSRVLHSIQRALRLARSGRMIARVCAWSDLGRLLRCE